jgi:hypothetical protein
MWWRVTFRGPELSGEARQALDGCVDVVVHDRDRAYDDEGHTALAFAATAEGAIDVVLTALEGHGAYDFFEAWPFPPPSAA